MTCVKSTLLEVQGLTKRYGAATALSNCAFNVRAGEIHALIGGNGAGKSTMARIIAGLVSPTGGKMTVAGQIYAPRRKRDAEIAGVEIVQQEFNLIPTLTVAENLLLTRLPAYGGVIRHQQLYRHAKAALQRLGLDAIAPDTLTERLGVGQQQMVEIAAALDRQCRLLILDEPTAALSAAEANTLFNWLMKLRADGVGMIYISHRLDEISRLANRVSVLQDGQVIGTYEAESLDAEQMVSLMTGNKPAHRQPILTKRDASKSPDADMRGDSDWAMRVVRLSGGIVREVSFEVNKGEKLGIAGLIGSGRTELLRLIFGADRIASGAVYLADDETPRQFRHPCEAVAAGVAMITEDRKRNGLLLTQPIRVNSTLAALRRSFSRAGLIRDRVEVQAAEEFCRSLEIRCTSIEQPTSTLSGGNQQKVVISRWLTTDARVYLFDEPTRGIDVPARKQIYRLIDSLAEQGKGIIIVSSDTEELFETCDRIAVMSNGMLVETLDGPPWSHDDLMRAAFSGYLAQESRA